MFYNKSLYYLLYPCTNPKSGKKSDFWDMDQNALSQSDCRILKSTRSLEQHDEKAEFLSFWYRLIKSESWLENIVVGVVKNG